MDNFFGELIHSAAICYVNETDGFNEEIINIQSFNRLIDWIGSRWEINQSIYEFYLLKIKYNQPSCALSFIYLSLTFFRCLLIIFFPFLLFPLIPTQFAMDLGENFPDVLSFLKGILEPAAQESEDVARRPSLLEAEGTFNYLEELLQSDLDRLQAEELRIEDVSKGLHASKANLVLEASYYLTILQISFFRSINQSINQSVNEATNQEPMIQVNQSINQSVNEATNQEPTIQSINQSTSNCAVFDFLLRLELYSPVGCVKSAGNDFQGSSRDEESAAKYINSFRDYRRADSDILERSYGIWSAKKPSAAAKRSAGFDPRFPRNSRFDW